MPPEALPAARSRPEIHYSTMVFHHFPWFSNGFPWFLQVNEAEIPSNRLALELESLF